MKPIHRAAVIGAGVMGSGIAAHLANAGIEVLLLDMVPPNLGEGEKKDRGARNRWSQGGLDKALKARPAAFFHPSFARLVTIGNVEDDLERTADCDLVIEAIIEKLEPKQQLFARLEKIVKPGCVVASNTSGLRIAEMMSGRSEAFRKSFLVMHFFNPVRYMKLLELVAGPDTDPAVFDRVRRFGEDVLGKGIVVGKDTPNFVGNRIGVHAMLATIHGMVEMGLQPEDVDAITGPAMAHPKSASFRTADLVGVDTFVHVADNCYSSLTEDEDREIFKAPEFTRAMLEKKILGDKTKGGFYRKAKDGGFETLDPQTLQYRPKGGDEAIRKAIKSIEKIESPAERLKKLVADGGKAGAFAWKVLSRSLAYSARRIGEIADSVTAVDDAMKWGYNWELGPFESWDALGFADTVDRMVKDGIALPDSIKKMRASGATGFYQGDKVYDLIKGAYVARHVDPRNATFAILKRGDAPVLKNDGAEAWDLGDGVLGLTFKTKANSIDADVISMLGKAAEKAEEDYRALVIHNDGDHFCVGANLFLIVMAASNKDWEQIRSIVKAYQDATQRLKYARVPVVGAPWGMTLGGGLELCFACDSVQAAAETYSGLVEVGVGLLPGGAGTLNMLWRALEGVPEGAAINTQEIVTQVFKNIALAKVATSADEAKALGYFRKTDGVSFDRARQLTEAKARAVGLAASGYHPPAKRAYKLPGESGIATLRMMVDTLVAGGYASQHDAKIAAKVAEVLCGGVAGASREVTEEEVLELEREAFVSLCGEPKSQERMQYMLMNNKPLRN
ncbi:3-hydroxyacyl-CoA dehydrogenase/enoyl-CoA hydratase family protein [Polyangium aurulentum]|uniref:3-hydroxyacyl-CoA dehydrogenase/enoyl-CoA hydratase family protein n=1 Tax=Polyangium aurulentum TaxID=2567896 RepID=UPI0010AE4370|nr:3-hydroxyacyl-CoA dehydrogenase/enoyl-CoA hydratase family protein [Polyangium aurulentum]UQA58827.1 3-hydroxyacyl-CoA dehydrogenase/enoyl-CoA hydratase family protein [Polyangium aurulentum]